MNGITVNKKQGSKIQFTIDIDTFNFNNVDELTDLLQDIIEYDKVKSQGDKSIPFEEFIKEMIEEGRLTKEDLEN